MITTQKVSTKKQLKQFVKFPFTLYKDCPYWSPPLIKDELETLNPEKNPVFRNAEAAFFLAFKDGKIVGRVAAIINTLEIAHKPKVRFGWLDMIDDLEVTKALLAEVTAFGKARDLEYMEGPMGFSNMEKAGILTEGFKELNTMITWYHYPYYAKHMETLGYEKQATWVEFRIREHLNVKEKIRKFSKLIKERYNLHVVRFSNKKDILPYVDAMFGLLNSTYNTLQTFVPIQDYQIAYYKTKYFNFIHPDYITCIEDNSGKLIAFSVVMPSFSRALQKANGRLFPLGWWHILRAQKRNNTAAFYLIGIDPEYQGKGVTAIIFHEMQELFRVKGIQEVETNPELIENTAVQALWKDYNPQQHKARSTYRKAL